MWNPCGEGLRRGPPTYFPQRKLRSLPLRVGTSAAHYCNYDIYRLPRGRDVLPGSHRALSCLPDILSKIATRVGITIALYLGNENESTIDRQLRRADVLNLMLP